MDWATPPAYFGVLIWTKVEGVNPVMVEAKAEFG